MPQILEEKTVEFELETQQTEDIVNVLPHRLSILQRTYVLLKSFADFIIALVALIVLVPVFIVTAIAIKVDSKGPVFFVQKRVGKGGKEFKCVKFRSMAQDAKHDVAGYEYAEVQSYITRVGKFIRKTIGGAHLLRFCE